MGNGLTILSTAKLSLSLRMLFLKSAVKKTRNQNALVNKKGYFFSINIDTCEYINIGGFMWDFIQNQILGMKWLNVLTENILNFFGLDTNALLGGSINFFL